MNRWLAGHAFWPLTEALMQRDTMSRLRRLQQTERASRDELRALQRRKLQALLRRAADHCPFYADRFRCAGLDPADPHLDLDVLAHLPTLSRDDVRHHLTQMTWRACPRGGPQPYTTGGSTGRPLKFHFDRFRQAADAAARWRARSWWGVRPGDPEILLWGAPLELAAHDRLRRWRDALLNQHLLNAFDMSDGTMADYARLIRANRPVCLYGYASSVALLARYALAAGTTPGGLGSSRLRAVFVTGEVLLEPDREAIETAFGAPGVIEYGCRDGGLLAGQCRAGRLHVPAENVIVELLDPAGRPVPPGALGEVTVTHLETYAMPLLRYRTGDLAREPVAADGSADHRCPCGSPLPALAEVRGRVTDQIVRRDHGRLRRMHALALMYVLREADGVRQFRITQPAVDELDVDLVTDATFTPVVEQVVTDGLRRRMGPDVAIRLHHRDRITPTASGKHACVVSHVDADALEPAPTA